MPGCFLKAKWAMDVTLIFPHQLFKVRPALQPGRHVYLVEEELLFN
jgi:hypothetical protein